MKAALLYPEWLESIQPLTLEERGELLTLILQFTAGEDAEPTSPAVTAAWGFVRTSLAANSKKYSEMCAKRAEASRKAVEARHTKNNQMVSNDTKCNQAAPIQNQNQNQNQNQPPKGGVINAHAPAREDVIDFFVAENSTREIGEAFYDYCDAENWTRKSGQPLIAWQSAARIWMREEYRRAQEQYENQNLKNQKNGKSGKQAPRLATAEDFDRDI